MKKLLFISRHNQRRSPTAEKLYKEKGYETRSAGSSFEASKPVSLDDLKWAEIVFVMEKEDQNSIRAEFCRKMDPKPIYILNIADVYAFMAPELIARLYEGVQAHLHASH